MSITVFCAALALQTVHADQVPAPMATPDQFIIQLPDVDHEALIGQVRALRSQLMQRKQVLEQVVADKRLGGSDAIISAVIPGGLLYAGYRISRYRQAKNKLARVSADIEEYSSDLLAMESRFAQVTIARLRLP